LTAGTNDLSVIVIGGGGHAKVVINVLRLMEMNIIGASDSSPGLTGKTVSDVPVLGGDEQLEQFAADSVILANGIGSIQVPDLRREIWHRFAGRGYRFITIVHPFACLAEGVQLGEGAQIMAGAILQPDVTIGRNAIINTAASIDHDCIIGDHVHIAPGATLSGNTTVGTLSHVGTGAKIVQGVTIGSGCLIRAGAVVIDDVPDGSIVAGIPARAA